jgi:hypothetical protein
MSHQLQAAYFHLNLNCIRKVLPEMELEHIIIHAEVVATLDDGQRRVLKKFGLTI